METKEMFLEWAKAQKAASLPCPRCGGPLNENLEENPFCTRAGVYICDECEMQEQYAAALDAKYAPHSNTQLPLSEWFLVSKVYGCGKIKFDDPDKGMHFLSAETSVMITDAQIKHIVLTAFKGVTKKWCVAPVTAQGLAVYPEYASSVVVQNGSLQLMIDKPGDFAVVAPEPLTKQNLLKGFVKWLEEGYDNGDRKVCVTNIEASCTVDTEAIDSLIADEIIQFAVFGEIKYEL